MTPATPTPKVTTVDGKPIKVNGDAGSTYDLRDVVTALAASEAAEVAASAAQGVANNSQTDATQALADAAAAEADAQTGITNAAAALTAANNAAADAANAQTTADAAYPYADSLVIGLLDDRGNHNASGNLFPSGGGSGTAGAILKGDLWTISVAGTLGGVAVTAGDVIRALVDAPSQTVGAWVVTENNLGYVPVNAAGTLSLAGFSGITGTLADANISSAATWNAKQAAITFGTGAQTALGVNVGSAGAFITFNGNAGTPSALVGTNITGTGASFTAGNVTTNANLTGPVTSTGNATAIANGAISNAMLANSAVANLSGTNTGDQTTISGNAGTATVLATARAINGVDFNGSAPITVTAAAGTLSGATLASGVTASSLTSTGTLTGGATGAGFTIALSTSTVTGSLADARLSANVALLNGTTAFTGNQTFSGKLALDTTGITSAFSATGALFTVAAKTQTDSTTGAGTVAVATGHDIEPVTFTTSANAITITDMSTLRIAGPSVASTNVTGTRKHSLVIVDSTSAASAITGGLVVATTLGTAATSVGIGGGNINAGGSITAAGAVTGLSSAVTNASTASSFSAANASNTALVLNAGLMSGSSGTKTGFSLTTPNASTQSGGQFNVAVISPTYNQTGTVGNTLLDLQAIETAVGSGTQYLIRARAGTTGATEMFNVSNVGVITTYAPTVLKGYTVATLPSTAATGKVQGATAFVTDALAPAFGVTVAGSGAVVIPVFYDGTNWICH